MKQTDRRSFLKLLAAGSVAAALPESIARALAIPASNQSNSINDVEHIVILMQENRSFDHYFGTLKGVRGFSDPRAVKLPNGDPVWKQQWELFGLLPEHVLPFHPPAKDLGLQFLEDLLHDWDTTHCALNNGGHDRWLPNKGGSSMAYMERNDIPYHYALADAFTVCDAYHCSLLGPTSPNRYHMFTGWVGNDGKHGGPAVDNEEEGHSWKTYPEVLEAAGISWKIYQDIGTGLDKANGWGEAKDPYIGNYGDNSLLFFSQYQNAPPQSALAEKEKTGTNIAASGTLFDVLAADVKGGCKTMPKVSWIIAPEAYSEHPNFPPNYGAWYISQVLHTLTSNPEVWGKTALFVTYDENDGFFDHMIPPAPPMSNINGLSTVSTKNEIYPGNWRWKQGPYGLGIRVPMLVISPWSKGGYVNSQVFDHTSLIRFIEKRFGTEENNYLRCDNITDWRRAVSGDLTSAFNFATSDTTSMTLPPTDSYLPPDKNRHSCYIPWAVSTGMPTQERGTSQALPLPYNLDAWGLADFKDNTFKITFSNSSQDNVAAVFHVRSGDPSKGPRSYTVESGMSLSDTWSGKTYNLSVYGPNGFFREFKGSTASKTNINVTLNSTYNSLRQIGFAFAIDAGQNGNLVFTDIYANKVTGGLPVSKGKTTTSTWSNSTNEGWYDYLITYDNDPSFSLQIAGHIENGEVSITDPAIGGSPKVS